MAYRSNNRQSNQKNCKFCKDSGKHENIYTSHNTKDKNGVVCCPILMTTLCNNCGNFGHTNKYCKSVKITKNNQTNTNANTKIIRVEITTKSQVNRFAVFENDEDEEDEEDEDDKKNIKTEKIIALPIRRRPESWADLCSDSDEE